MADAAWDQWQAATCRPDHCFCEAIRDGPVRQPANAWSSLAFVAAAILIVMRARADRRDRSGVPVNAMTTGTAWPAVYVVALVVTGLGSAFFHASLTLVGQFLDVLGMYLIATFILLYNVGRLRPISQVVTVVSYLSLNIVLAGLLLEVPTLRRYLFAVVLTAAVALELTIRARRTPVIERRFFVGALIVIVVAFAIWVLDITKVACDPGSVLQGHALWHVLGAVASWLLYRYYRSERHASS